MPGSVLKMLRNEPDADKTAPTGEEPESAPLAPDPKPKRTSSRSSKPSAATVRTMASEITVGLKFFAGVWTMRDQHCAPVLNEHAKAIAGELAEILAEDARVAAWFEQTVGFGKWIKLAMVVQPVVEAVLDHHVFRDVSRETPEEVAVDGVPFADLPAFHPGERYAS